MITLQHRTFEVVILSASS